MATFIWVPSYSTAVERAPKILKAQFGDNYAQRAKDGINANPLSISIVFDDITGAVKAAIDAFLEDLEGTTPFNFTLPGGVEKQYVCEKWSYRYSAYDSYSMQMTFVEDFSP